MLENVKSKCGRFELRFVNGVWAAFCFHTYTNVDRFRRRKDGVDTFNRLDEPRPAAAPRSHHGHKTARRAL